MPASKLLIAPLLPILRLSFVLSSPLTAYELLKRYNLPLGLIPKGFESFILQKDDSFDGECEFEVQDKYLLQYEWRISGKLEDEIIKVLDGVVSNFLFIWLGKGEVVRVGDELRFYVGSVSASFPVPSFKDYPKCHWGLDWHGRGVGSWL